VVDLQPGDRILLCSDGCSGVLDSDRLADILGTGTVDFAVVELVRASLEAGSSDNITCVAADVVGPDAPPSDPDTSAAASTGAMLVGAAAEQPRRTGAGTGPRSFFRGHRGGDTGELEPVPGERETPSDPEELRYAPRAPQRFVWLRRLLVVAVVLGLVAVALVAAYRWTQGQYYVAAADDHVAIYRGVPADLPGVDLHSVAERTELPLAALPPYRAEQVRAGISADGLADARKVVGRMTDLAAVCPTPEPTPTTSPKPTRKSSAKATGKATGKASPTVKPSPSTAPAPTPTPSPTLTPPDCIESTAGASP
jgi:protein phosphatase